MRVYLFIMSYATVPSVGGGIVGIIERDEVGLIEINRRRRGSHVGHFILRSLVLLFLLRGVLGLEVNLSLDWGFLFQNDEAVVFVICFVAHEEGTRYISR